MGMCECCGWHVGCHEDCRVAAEMFEACRKKLESELARAALNLFEHMAGASSFLLPLDDGGIRVIAAGSKADIRQIIG